MAGKKVNVEKGKQGFQQTTPVSPQVPVPQDNVKKLKDEPGWYSVLHPFKAAKRRRAESAEWDAKDATALKGIARSLTEYANVSAKNAAALKDIERLLEERQVPLETFRESDNRGIVAESLQEVLDQQEDARKPAEDVLVPTEEGSASADANEPWWGETMDRLIAEQAETGNASVGPVGAPDCMCGHAESIHDTPGRYGNPAYCLEGNGACKCREYTPVR